MDLQEFCFNLIYFGDVYSLCIACNKVIHSKEEIELHARKINHQRRVRRKEYIEPDVVQYKGEFYCERCNFYSLSKDNMMEHVKSKAHVNCKALDPRLKTKAAYEPEVPIQNWCDRLLIDDTISISMTEWLGCDIRYCYVCDELLETDKEIDNDIKSPLHMVNLIKTRIRKWNMNYYRVVGPKCNIIHCLTCSDIFDRNHPDVSKEKHWTEPGHQDKLKEAVRKVRLIKDFSQEVFSKCTPQYHALNYYNDEDLMKLIAECLMHVNSPEEVNLSIYEEYWENYKIKLLASDRGICKLCNTTVTADLTSIITHLRSPEHLNILSGNIVDEKIYLLRYITKVKYNAKDLIKIDRIHQIKHLQFSFCTSLLDNKIYCNLCDVTLEDKELVKHCELFRHRTLLFETKVMKNDVMEKHFIREMAPNRYHCPYCDIFLNSYDEIKKHLGTDIHENRITSSGTTLEDVKIEKIRKKLEYTAPMDIFSIQDKGGALI